MTSGRSLLTNAMSLGALLPMAALLAVGCGGDGGPTDPGPEPEPDPLVLSAVSGDGQTGPTDDSLPDPLVVQATQGGASTEGETVEWALVETPGSGAALASETTDTGTDGQSSNRLVLSSEEGPHRVRAILNAGPDTVEFTATAEDRRADQVQRESGDGQSATVEEPVDDSLVVRVRDQFGDPLPDAIVEFEVTRGASAGPTVDPDSTRTDSAGRAATALTLGAKNGTYAVAALTAADTVAFEATASGGSEFLLAIDSVRPSPLQAGESATVFGDGFDPSPSGNTVLVDGESATVTGATSDELQLDVPTYTDECLPGRPVDVEVIVSPDSAPPVTEELEPSVDPVQLAAGEDTVLSGPSAVNCVLLPGASAGSAEYEVVATATPQTLGNNLMDLSVNGRAAGGSPSRAASTLPTSPGGPGDRTELPDWRRTQYEFDRRLRERGRARLPDVRARSRSAPSMSRNVGRITPDVASQGDSTDFAVSCTSQESVRAVARTVSDAAVIYEDTVMESTGKGFTQAQYDSIAARFDTLTFAVDTTYFGAPADIDENGRVVMLFTPAVNRLDGDYSDGFIVGFFCSADLLSGGNEAEMFYLVSPDPDGGFTPADDDGLLTGPNVRSIIEGTVIHEFQHLINAQIGGGSSPSTPSVAGAQETWLNEGLSHLAEEVGGHAQSGNEPGQQLAGSDLTADATAANQFYGANFRNLANYLASPPAGPGPIAGSAGFRTRGASWSFVRYLLDRFVAPSEEHEFTRAIIQSTAASARGVIEDAIQTVAGESVEFEDVLTDWNALYAVEDRSDVEGSPRPELGLSSYQLRDVYGDDFFGSGGAYPLTPTSVGLHESTTVDATLFTGTGRYVRLVSSSESAGTGLKLAEPGGEPLSSDVDPRLVLIRTR